MTFLNSIKLHIQHYSNTFIHINIRKNTAWPCSYNVLRWCEVLNTFLSTWAISVLEAIRTRTISAIVGWNPIVVRIRISVNLVDWNLPSWITNSSMLQGLFSVMWGDFWPEVLLKGRSMLPPSLASGGVVSGCDTQSSPLCNSCYSRGSSSITTIWPLRFRRYSADGWLASTSRTSRAWSRSEYSMSKICSVRFTERSTECERNICYQEFMH